MSSRSPWSSREDQYLINALVRGLSKPEMVAHINASYEMAFRTPAAVHHRFTTLREQGDSDEDFGNRYGGPADSDDYTLEEDREWMEWKCTGCKQLDLPTFKPGSSALGLRQRLEWLCRDPTMVLIAQRLQDNMSVELERVDRANNVALEQIPTLPTRDEEDRPTLEEEVEAEEEVEDPGPTAEDQSSTNGSTEPGV